MMAMEYGKWVSVFTMYKCTLHNSIEENERKKTKGAKAEKRTEKTKSFFFFQKKKQISIDDSIFI